MIHSFDTEIAEEYGMLEAVLLNNIYYWIEKNRANDVNYFDGRYWTFNSTRAFNELFPYVSERQIKNALKHLREEGILLTGNYNKSSYDRTLWYALSEKGLSIMQKCPMEEPKKDNETVDNVPPIPDINTDINTDDLTVSKETVRPTGAAGRIIAEWNTLSQFGIKEISKICEGTQRQKWLSARLRQYPEEDFMSAIENIRHSGFLQGKNKRGWTITFDWFLRPNNFPKVLEGNYNDDDIGGTPPGNSQSDWYDPAIFERLANESRDDVQRRHGGELGG